MDDKLTRRQLIAGALAGDGLASLATQAGGQDGSSTLFREVSLVDGTGAPPISLPRRPSLLAFPIIPAALRLT